jgi:parvulin-like peptidyl-prolyl isomerase
MTVFAKVIEKIRNYDVKGATDLYVAMIIGGSQISQEQRKEITLAAQKVIVEQIDQHKKRMQTKRRGNPNETISYP